MNTNYKINPKDIDFVSASLGRYINDFVDVPFRDDEGNPVVITCPPKLGDSRVMPTTYYLVGPKWIYECSKLEANGYMKELEEKLSDNEDLKASYLNAHKSYIEDRKSLGSDSRLSDDFSAGGMPLRVKCLHALVAHSLAKGKGVNPIGDIAVKRIQIEMSK